ncbi:L-arabinose ABC transporter ATP-binding protein AraG [Duganella violaceipulchra]|uniref:L-arabinose ABC transporter ATP-binding protein AraG n=1 Tax=Duganella violaceipulchra TaxID=2849652 RepID=A0AA41L801_9BURK|nr:L-arabinose ABC transporter ATP-binding protein AraG [Duganella violaceicalia]MBV6324867.1 L-arabinose ABC transporter ATP-binding protein AraG [Duganella violaceicalia]MCP2012194.1 L-arabinose transport system ATP-binding protein [Duganella violaceicalia]
MTAYLQFDQVSKVFPGVKALNGVSFAAHAGQVHGLLGENGAGKSTLLKILGGQYKPDGGRLLVDGKECRFTSAKDAIGAGIAVIHQELQYVPELTVAENILLGRMPTRFGLLDKPKAHRMVAEKLAAIGVDLAPDARLADLSIAQRQMVEICKAIMQDAQVIAFDEPTSSLSHRETEILFRLVKELRADGRTLIYISHRLEELYALCDACTIFRDGRKIVTHNVMADVPRERLISDMVGRELSDIYDYRTRPLGEERLKIQGLAGKHVKGPQSFSVRGGEVLGFFGLVGAGRSELMRLLYNADARSAGSVVLDGATVSTSGPSAAIAAGIVLCPEDRKEQGILSTASVAENINISVRRHDLLGGLFLRHKREAALAEEFIARLRIKTPNRQQEIRLLSGGNQQKVILARWLAEPGLKVLILDEPTRGIDVGAKNDIYRIIHEVAERGCCVIVVSSELPEVLGISDRVIVMREGEICGELSRADASETEVLRLALPDSIAPAPAAPHIETPALPTRSIA